MLSVPPAYAKLPEAINPADTPAVAMVLRFTKSRRVMPSNSF
jgi:hypothetical protein